LEKLPVGTILFPAEGEEHNSIFAVRFGWTVSAIDISSDRKKKANQLAETHKVTIDYQVGELETLPYAAWQFDTIAFMYTHFPVGIKSNYQDTQQLFT
jgi:hypothetical protein